MKISVITPIISATKTEMYDIRQQKRLEDTADLDVQIDFQYIENGPESIEGEYEDAYAVPETVRLAIHAEKKGADAILINCTADTGLNVCREAVGIPVVAPTMSSFFLAAQLTHKFSVLTFLESVNSRFEKMAWNWGFNHKLASVRSVNIPVLGLVNNQGKLINELISACQSCYELDHAHGIVLGCTDFEDVADQVQEGLDRLKIPLLLFRPYRVAIQAAVSLVNLKVSQSKLSYPYPKKYLTR